MKITLVALGLALAGGVVGQTYLQTFQYKTPYTPGSQLNRFTVAAVSKNGQFLVGGNDSSGATLAVHYRNGVLKQIVHLGTPDQQCGSVYQILVHTDGTIYVVAQGYGTTTSGDYFIAKLDANYNPLWQQCFNYQGNGDFESPGRAVLDSNGNVYICGITTINSAYKPFLAKVTSAGGVAFTRLYTGLAAAPNAQYVVTRPDGGYWWVIWGGATLHMVGEDASGANKQEASKTYPLLLAYDAASDVSGYVYVAGTVQNGGNRASIIRFNPNDLTFLEAFPTDPSSTFYKVQVTADGVIGVGPSGYGPITNAKFSLASFPTMTWKKDFRYLSNSYDLPSSITADSWGELYVSGYTTTGAYDRYVTYKIGATGTLRWFNVWDPYSNRDQDHPGQVVVHDPSGDVFVCGENVSGTVDPAHTSYRQAAIAVPDSYHLKKNTVYNSPTITYNDRYWLGCSITVEQAPAHGQIVLNANRTVRYTPNPGFVGTDLFRYRLSKVGVNPTIGSVTFFVEP